MSADAATLSRVNRQNGISILEAKIDRFSYGRKTALRNVSLKVPKNRITAFIGPSGCGKSTTLRCFNRMHPQNRTKL